MFTYMYAISLTASRKTTALIRNGALPLSSNHSAFPNSSPQTGSGSSFFVCYEEKMKIFAFFQSFGLVVSF